VTTSIIKTGSTILITPSSQLVNENLTFIFSLDMQSIVAHVAIYLAYVSLLIGSGLVPSDAIRVLTNCPFLTSPDGVNTMPTNDADDDLTNWLGLLELHRDGMTCRSTDRTNELTDLLDAQY